MLVSDYQCHSGNRSCVHAGLSELLVNMCTLIFNERCVH